MSTTFTQLVLGLAFRGALCWAKGVNTDPDDQEGVLPGDEDPPAGTLPGDEVSPVTEEIFSSWALFIMLFLLISALWSSYFLTQRRIKAVHETVLSIFYGMVVGLIIRLSPGHYIQDAVTFNSSYFFNILLPPIILNSGYELNQVNFFNNIVSILVFAIPGTFISSVVLGVILYIWTALGLESIDISFVDALSVGATLSATDPVTILSIFNAYKVDPKLYTIIFGESLLNDAISIVMFETCQKFHGKPAKFSSFFEGIGLFLMTFTVSLLIGVMIGILVALLLKHTLIRRYPRIESCLVLLIAYESYFFSNGCHMSGIVSLLFCGITLKHYAYFNMSRRTQITVKYIFQLLAQLSENFIFIYLGLSLFTEVELVYKPLLIIITGISICVARWCAVFPLSNFVNWLYRVKARRSMGIYGNDAAIPDEIPYQYQMMTFWAGLRGAVGVALAMGLQGEFKFTLLATVLVVVVLTVIIFGGTTAGMLEVLGIKTGCIDENDESDDEFDIEMPKPITLATGPIASYTDEVPSVEPISVPISTATATNPLSSDTVQSSSRVSLDKQHLRETLSTIFSADSQWFTNFDEQVLKPVFLDSDNSQSGKKSDSSTPNIMGNRK
ncbi:bifunctional K:H/Na:H antiporter NHX1 [Lachancea thermotolerans CBS 6340]|uniref:Sodium/hydrogen exchanger n=1 Tax=Lachancea thermotolerans (strain ATCC 56472 / CBS 6340 / NRRL Y-8284) TaxID=559295 RepID=C5DLZ9_LACTC|nr:KLTH0G04818p [Lachancea thermotolerans CBS 6340]CAR24810.1 KLTH0G04818p [Lachancea thermotolerans CBS 6340]